MCATNTSEKHATPWGDLSLGMHVCSIHRNDAEQFRPLVPFFSDGLTQKQKCMYIFDNHTPDEVYSEFDKASTEPGKFRSAVELEVIPPQQTYMQNGVFDPTMMIALLGQTINDSVMNGYSGVRAAAEMSWVLSSETPLERLFEYESKLNEFYPTSKLVGVCQFDEEKFTPDVLIQMIRSHPYLIIYGRLYLNRYFYSDFKYGLENEKQINSSDYQTILSIILDDEPVA